MITQVLFFQYFFKNDPHLNAVKYKKLVEILKNNDYTTETLLHYLHHQKYYKLIGIDLSGQTNTSIPPQINLIGKLEEDDATTMFSIAEKQQKTIPNFYLDSLIVKE